LLVPTGLLCLAKTPDGSSCRGGRWRQWLDLEHGEVYNMTNHWSALTDGHMKYIFNAWDATEELFNLTADPGETTQLQNSPQYGSLLHQHTLFPPFLQSSARRVQWCAPRIVIISIIIRLHFNGHVMVIARPCTCHALMLGWSQASDGAGHVAAAHGTAV